jgi:hypothetical protein
MVCINAAEYWTERNRMLFAKQYLVGAATTDRDQFCVAHPVADQTWAAMKELFYSQLAPT